MPVCYAIFTKSTIEKNEFYHDGWYKIVKYIYNNLMFYILYKSSVMGFF